MYAVRRHMTRVHKVPDTYVNLSSSLNVERDNLSALSLTELRAVGATVDGLRIVNTFMEPEQYMPENAARAVYVEATDQTVSAKYGVPIVTTLTPPRPDSNKGSIIAHSPKNADPAPVQNRDHTVKTTTPSSVQQK